MGLGSGKKDIVNGDNGTKDRDLSLKMAMYIVGVSPDYKHADLERIRYNSKIRQRKETEAGFGAAFDAAISVLKDGLQKPEPRQSPSPEPKVQSQSRSTHTTTPDSPFLTSPWQTAAHAQTGTSHIKKSKPCEDAYSIATTDTALAIVVCDGASTSSHSKFAAEFVSKTMADNLITLATRYGSVPSDPNDPEFAQAVEITRDALGKNGKKEGFKYTNEVNCTMIACVATPGRAALLHIGDGFGYVARTDRNDAIFSRPANGATSSETFFVSSASWRDNLRVQTLDRPGMIFLGTDGASFLLDKGDDNIFEAHAHYIHQTLFSKMSSQEARNDFLRGRIERYENLAFGDDVTVAWAGLNSILQPVTLSHVADGQPKDERERRHIHSLSR